MEQEEKATKNHGEGFGSGFDTLAKELAKPVYEDGLRPAVLEAGRALETVMGLVNVILTPAHVLVYGAKQIEPILKEGISRRLIAWGTKVEEIQAPPAYIAVPVIEALRYAASVEELREMFLNLIAASMDSQRANAVHPSFVEILKQLDPDEGRILLLFLEQKALPHWSLEVKRHRKPPDKGGYFETGQTFVRQSLIAKDAHCTNAERVPACMDNLLRLGLVHEPRPWSSQAATAESLRDPKADPNFPGFFYAGQRVGELMDLHPEFEEIAGTFQPMDHFEMWRGEIRLTEFGKAFCLSCVAWEDPNGFLAFGAQGERLLNNRVRV